MSNLLSGWAKFFLKGSPLRTYVETLVLGSGLILLSMLIYDSEVETMMPTTLLFLVVPCCGLYYSLRLRVPTGRWYRRFAIDLLYLIVPLVVFNGILLVYVYRLLVSANDLQTGMAAVLFVGFYAFPYLFFRVSVRLLVWWNGLRQRRLIWSLVTSHLIAVGLLQALIVLPIVALIVGSMSSSSLQLPSHPLVQVFYRLQLALPFIGVSILVATAVLVVLLPVSIVVSYFFARRIKRRLDTLLDAAHAAGDGNYAVRVPVTGQDEIAKLQTDFNAMAASLGVTVSELRSEREKVDALLKSRRELMASVSHELRTPIATVRAYLELGAAAEPRSGRHHPGGERPRHHRARNRAPANTDRRLIQLVARGGRAVGTEMCPTGCGHVDRSGGGDRRAAGMADQSGRGAGANSGTPTPSSGGWLAARASAPQPDPQQLAAHATRRLGDPQRQRHPRSDADSGARHRRRDRGSRLAPHLGTLLPQR